HGHDTHRHSRTARRQNGGVVGTGQRRRVPGWIIRSQGDAPMTTWTSGELDQIERAEELEIAPRRHDDTLHGPVTIWVVRVGDDLYVRSYRGRGGVWFRAAQMRHEGC